MFTKLHVSVQEYGGKTNSALKMKNSLQQSIAQCGIFMQSTAISSNNWTNKPPTSLKAAVVMLQVVFAARYLL